MSISQMALVAAIMKHVAQEMPTLNARQTNAIIDGANLIVAELNEPEREFKPGCGIYVWLRSDKTGSSSLFMASTLQAWAGACLPQHKYAHPHDPSDLGRCLGLLDACPALRVELPRMAATGPVWAGLVEAWDELERLYREEFPTGTAPKCYARMKEIIGKAEGR